MAESVNNCSSTELVNEDSKFNEDGVRRFVEEVNLAERDIDYAIVSVIGPQSSGKSTLLNHVFGTNFKVMNVEEGRSRATEGIWLAQSPTLGPRYLVIDADGIDGGERGDDTTFEKRHALLALAISDIVILNMWCTDVGLVHGMCQPHLRIIFQVMQKLFPQRKINLIIVLRDKTETPLDKLKVLLEKDIQKIWNDSADPQEWANSALDQHFNIEVVGMSHYHYAEAEFKREVCRLKQLVEDYCTVGRVNPDWTPSSNFVDKAIATWDKIVEIQDLDLSIINESIATANRGEISSVQYNSFHTDEVRDIKQLVEDSCTVGVNPDWTPGSDFVDEKMTIWDKIMENQDLDLPIINESIAMARCPCLDEISNVQYDSFRGDKLVEDSCTVGRVNPNSSPSSDFVETITIKNKVIENQDLDLPIINESIAMARCDETSGVQYESFYRDKESIAMASCGETSSVQYDSFCRNELVEDSCTVGRVNPNSSPSSDFVETITIKNKVIENQDLDLPIINESIAMACCDETSGVQYESFYRDKLVEDSCTVGRVNPDWTLSLDSVESIAMARCGEISSVQYDSFCRDETWRQIEEVVKSSRVQGFGMQVHELIGKYLLNFDKETLHCDEIVWNQKRIQLEENMLQVVMPAYHSMLEHIRRDSLQNFHEAFENEMINNSAGFSEVARKCIDNFLTELDNQLQDASIQELNWSDATNLPEQLLRHVNEHVEEVRRKKVDDLFKEQRMMLKNKLRGPIDSHLRAANEMTWVEIRRELESKTQKATVQLLGALSTYELDEEMRHNLVRELENHGRNFVRAKASREANPRLVIPRMKKRFVEVFLFDSNTTIRVLKDNAEVETAIKIAKFSVAKMLSVLAAVRIVDHNDTIEETLLYATRNALLDTLSLINWKQVIEEDIILQPWRCKFLWNQFLTEIEPIVNQVSEEVRKKRWKKYATAFLGSLAVCGGAVAIANFPVIAAGAASAARSAFAASGIGTKVLTTRTIASGATTVATTAAAYFGWVPDLRQLVEDSCKVGGINQYWTPGSNSGDQTTMILDKIIMENQDLGPTILDESMAMAHCGEISGVQYESFRGDETWSQIEEVVKSSRVQGFGMQVNELIGKYLSNFDEETLCCDEIVWNQKRIQLKETMLQVVKPAYHSMLEHIRRDSLQSFHEAFDNGMKNNSAGFSNVASKCVDNFLTKLDNQLQDAFIQESNWSHATSLREQLLQHVNDHVDDLRRKKVDGLIRQHRIMLANELEGPIRSHLRAANEITWLKIRKELESSTRLATYKLLNALSTFELDKEMRHNLVRDLENHGRNFVRAKARETANPRLVLSRMKKRFIEQFSFDSNMTRRVWEEYGEVEAAIKTAQSSVVKMLSVLAAVRIIDRKDTIEETLLYATRNGQVDTLTLTNWEQVIQEDILLQPSLCKDLWNDFLTKISPIVDQAVEEVRTKKWKKYATIFLHSLAVGGGAVAVSYYNRWYC